MAIFATTKPLKIRTCAYHGVRNVSFSENIVYVLNEWSQSNFLYREIRKFHEVIITITIIIIIIINIIIIIIIIIIINLFQVDKKRKFLKSNYITSSNTISDI